MSRSRVKAALGTVAHLAVPTGIALLDVAEVVNSDCCGTNQHQHVNRVEDFRGTRRRQCSNIPLR